MSQPHVLITRPLEAGVMLAEVLDEHGYISTLIPCMQIQALAADEDQQAIKSQVLNLDYFDHVIFISTNAVRFGSEVIMQFWPQLPIAQQYYGIGAATCQAMLAADLPAQTPPDQQQPMNSEALLALPTLQDLVGQKVLIMRGQNGREHLAEVLRARGAVVKYCELYRRTLPDLTSAQLACLNSANFDAVIVNSAETLQNLRHLITSSIAATLDSKPRESGAVEKWSLLPIIVPSARVATVAANLGFNRVVQANNAASGATLTALAQIFEP